MKKRNVIAKFIFFIMLAFLSMELFAEQSTADSHLKKLHRLVLAKWLSKQTEFRLATDADCKCDEDIYRIKQGYGGAWKAIPDYHPYYSVGDFNSDGTEDFAIALIDETKSSKQFAIAIFNGPFVAGRPKSESLFREGLELTGRGFAFGPPRPKPYRLIFGPFESDNTSLFVPRGKGYKMK